MPPWARRLRRPLALLAALLTLARVPAWLVGYDASAALDDRDARAGERALAGLEALATRLDGARFGHGDGQFEGEWRLVAHVGAGLAAGHLARAHPALRPRAVALLRRLATGLEHPRLRAFDRARWGDEDALEALGSPRSHLAYVGYANVVYSALRRFDPAGPHAARNDALSAHLAASYERAGDALLVETYPGELYPADNAVALASLALHARATGADGGALPLLPRVREAYLRRYRDAGSGLLHQRLAPQSLAPVDAPRASGTAFSAWFLGYVDAALARVLYRSVAAQQRALFGFGAVREYASGAAGGLGDVDSGPVLFGLGVAPTGFALGAARLHGDRERFAELYATAQLFGLPTRANGVTSYVTVGALGDALLAAALSARGDL